MYSSDYPRDHRAAYHRFESLRKRQEASKGFDAEDDLEFCPSLTHEELNEIRHHIINAQRIIPPRTPSPAAYSHYNMHSHTPTKAIPIVDPNSKPANMRGSNGKSGQTATVLPTSPISPYFSPSSSDFSSSTTSTASAVWGGHPFAYGGAFSTKPSNTGYAHLRTGSSNDPFTSFNSRQHSPPYELSI